MMKPICDGLLNLYIGWCQEEHCSLSNSHKTAKESDIKNMVVICYWVNDYEMGNTAFFIVGQTKVSGWAMETAVIPF
jgi:hypothetical protein